MIIKIAKSRPRLVTAFLLGALLSAVLPLDWNLLSRALFGWNAAVWSYLLLMLWLMFHATSAKVAQLADQEDKADLAIVAIMSIASLASMIAITLELATLKDLTSTARILHYGVTIATVVGSWCFMATIFTFHYAKLYYRSPVQHRALRFPDEGLHPNYWDFLYFSFTIAVAAQTSDVCLASTSIRKTALAQSVLSFWFNMAILGMSINIAAGLVGA